jgi:hypothetical protein
VVRDLVPGTPGSVTHTIRAVQQLNGVIAKVDK